MKEEIKENWQKEYWKLWGHLKDTPMAKIVYSFILKAQKETKQALAERLEEIVKKEDCRAGEPCGSERLKDYIQQLKQI